MPALGDLPAGSHGTVTALAGDPALVQRLYELGLFEGERIEVVGFAPLGDPVEPGKEELLDPECHMSWSRRMMR